MWLKQNLKMEALATDYTKSKTRDISVDGHIKDLAWALY